MNADVHLAPGTRLDGGRFEIVRDHGRGAYGLTYLARDHACDGREVALKEYFPPAAERNGEAVSFANVKWNYSMVIEAVTRESFTTDVVDHPAVARRLHSFAENATAYIVVEWIDGPTLQKRWGARRIEPQVLINTFLTVLDVILEFAESGISHLDMHGGNIMFRGDQPIVIDFGLAEYGSSGSDLSEGFRADLRGLSVAIRRAILRSEKDSPLSDVDADDPRITGFDPAFLACLDKGAGEQPVDSGAAVLDGLGELLLVQNAELARRIRAHESLPALGARRAASGAGALHRTWSSRFQRCLLQSFDTARFQKAEALRRDRTPLISSLPTKIALARTEAVLSILFGREIVVPAGQVAESPAFYMLFQELMPAYLRRSDAIDEACSRAALPPFRPMRLALEDFRHENYVDYVTDYAYTGAPMVLLESAGRDAAEQDVQRRQIDGFKKLFLAKEYGQLEKAMDIPEYSVFATNVRSYFNGGASVHATRDIAPVALNDYKRVFFRRLKDRNVRTDGLDDPEAVLYVVEKVESDLRQAEVHGYRGNWYLYAEKFGLDWSLARAYLDLRLYLTLSRQYRVDHPVLISQEFEYGKYDHSLYLGPSFSSSMDSIDENPLLSLLSHFAIPINWDDVFALYEDPEFLAGIAAMNDAYFTKQDKAYLEAVEKHGGVINELAGDIIKVSSEDGEVRISGASDARSIAFSSIEPVGRGAEVRDQIARASLEHGFGSIAHDCVAVGTMTSRDDGEPVDLGAEASRAIQYYFAKPYRVLAESDE